MGIIEFLTAWRATHLGWKSTLELQSMDYVANNDIEVPATLGEKSVEPWELKSLL